MNKLAITSLLCISAAMYAAEITEKAPNPTDIRIVKVESMPIGDHVETTLVFPEPNQVVTRKEVNIQIRLEGFPLGIDSVHPRSREVKNSNEGQSMHVVVDNHPYFAINEAIVDTLEDVDDYYEQVLDFDVPFSLEEGMHVLRIFPARSFNESVKGNKSFVAGIFYYKNKSKQFSVDLNKPYLTYNEPQGSFSGPRPILLDFYLCNCELSQDGYKVRLTIDGTLPRILTSWSPYYIYGLEPGEHKIRLELLDPQNKPVPGPFNDVTRSISVK